MLYLSVKILLLFCNLKLRYLTCYILKKKQSYTKIIPKEKRKRIINGNKKKTSTLIIISLFAMSTIQINNNKTKSLFTNAKMRVRIQNVYFRIFRRMYVKATCVIDMRILNAKFNSYESYVSSKKG